MEGEELTIFYDFQCPYILQSVELARSYCQETGTPVTFHPVDSLEKAKALPVCSTTGRCFIRESSRR